MREGYGEQGGLSTAWEAGHGIIHYQERKHHEQFDSPHGPIECWLELVSVDDGRVHLVGHNVFKATGDVVVASEELRFRTLPELTDSLFKAGFTLEQVYGDWDRGPLSSTSRAMVFIARRT